MKTAILYSRFSSKSQADGDSLRRQTQLAEEFCKKHGLELSELTFQDLGISGWKNTKRDGLESLLEAVETGKIPNNSYVLVEATDRLSRRGMMTVLTLVHRLVKTGCKFVTIDNNQIYDSENIETLTGTMPLLISADLAAQESNRKSQRVRAAKTAAKDKRVIQGRQPFWITIKDGKPELNDNAELARRIVQMSLDGKRPLAIVRALNSDNIPSPNGGVWYVAVIRNILKNTILYGAKTYFEARDGSYKPVETVSGLYPPICSFVEFKQITVGKGKKGRKQTGPLSTLLRCECGRPLIAKTKRGNDVYRVCGGTIDNTCDKKGYYKNIDDIIMSQLTRIKVPETKPVVENEEFTKRIDELEQEIEGLNVMRNANRGKPAILQMVFEEIDRATKEIEELQDKRPIMIPNLSLQSVVELVDVDKQNSILKSLIRVVECAKTSAYKTAVMIRFRTGYNISFFVDQGRKTNGYQVVMKSDGEALKNWIEENNNDEFHGYDE
ncbi:recombinase family protein [Aeromonas piscicola]|uniref:recombinase family protein n=1 Tax=Aeromonas piscicola TaxID=600645 RepID=UPI0021F8DB47|nr:recombinase family protein [Aeromonas piscicola]MCW0507023.1 recombinase family protein [Aeromonas piscicola]